MWQRFTEDARNVILLAQEEAARAQSAHVDTEHLLLGWLRLGERSEQLLQEMSIKADVVRTEAAHFVEQHPRGEKEQEPRLTPTAKLVLELAADEARRMLHNHIGTEHLLLGLVRGTRGLASQILQSQGAELERLRLLVKQESAGPEPTTEVPLRAKREPDVEFADEVADVLWSAFGWAKSSHHDVGTEQLLLALLERREDLLVEITGLDVLALKKARYKLLINLDLFEEATQLRDEIAESQS